MLYGTMMGSYNESNSLPVVTSRIAANMVKSCPDLSFQVHVDLQDEPNIVRKTSAS
ncbi:uncharacterized protein CIMG_11164 [Coccidioides immitis RS]|uniref:Uncharacterized protein n=3 Tax=Coccidioides immitis TaxID=5501 RepID=A0A0D8JW43_COCIM|nr:uncharacterized protein CIMG_11164 [Coccidioides immitis RS]KJF61537.1 hypothetical protein CIMG_11164 [Coccidioides immitis RS]KMP07871.1 hypothetical protein CIRG_07552 [Coccidioides immitis RMSCC 2394]KMU79768.1 hypothetical protein CISG_08048 [Coccidioides immitis RMSCC 3703]